MYTPSHEATDMIHCLYELKESARRTLAWYGDPHAAAAGAFPEPPAYPPPETLNAPGIWVKFGSGPPKFGAIAPDFGAIAPNLGATAPNLCAIAPKFGAIALNLGAIAPNLGAIAPNLCAIARKFGAIAPNLVAI